MTAFTPSAESRLNDYLTQVRQALFAHPDVSPDEVEADVREHIDTEFAGLNRPVTLGELEAVLARLGPPTQWANAGAVTQAGAGVPPFDWKGFAAAVRRRTLGVFATLWRGPEDWRLPYITFALTLLAPLTFGVSLVVAFFFGRAAIELAKEKGTPLGARRWLVYPAILAIIFPLLAAILFVPPVLAGVSVAEVTHTAYRWEKMNWQTEVTVLEETPPPAKGERPAPAKWTKVKAPIPEAERASHEKVLTYVRQMPGSGDFQEVAFVAFAFVGGLAAWWTILGLVMWAVPKWVTTIFHPLFDGYDYLHGVRMAACCGVATLIWVGFASRVW
jgi:hypothetical protein